MSPSMVEVAERVLELDALADPGPWNADEYHDILMGNGCLAFENDATNDWDAEFIAYTRTAAPDLAREVITVHAELAQAREANRWIPTSERLPEPDYGENVSRQVQAFNEMDILSPCVYVLRPFKAFEEGWYHHGKKIYDLITHWRPLPEPPGGDD